MMKIPLGRRCDIYAMVDDEDYYELLKFPWRCTGRNRDPRYAVTDIRFKGVVLATFYMHNMIMQAQKGEEVDHIDHDGLNNQKANLRFATRQQQMVNTRRKTGPSGYRGVRHAHSPNGWQAVITVHGRYIGLGTFSTPEAAAVAYNDAAQKYFGVFAQLNIIKSSTEETVQ